MTFKNILISTAAASLAVAPVAAQAAPASRDSAPAAASSDLFGGDVSRGAIIAVLAGIGMLVLILSDDDDDEDVFSV